MIGRPCQKVILAAGSGGAARAARPEAVEGGPPPRPGASQGSTRSVAVLQPFMSGTPGPLAGTARVPGDKSISHRALMVGALAVGESEIHGLLEGEDVLRSAAAMRALGAEAWRDEKGVWRVIGRGVGGLSEPADVLDLANAGTGARLLMGVVATHRLTAFFTGDASLRRRPMARVVTPLSQMGATFTSR